MPSIEKDAFVIFYAEQKLDQHLHDSEFVIRIGHKPVRYIMDSPVQNIKIQHWTINIHGYHCKIEYIVGKKNACADMLSCLPHRPSDSKDGNEVAGLDITDKTFEVSMINSSALNSAYNEKKYA